MERSFFLSGDSVDGEALHSSDGLLQTAAVGDCLCDQASLLFRKRHGDGLVIDLAGPDKIRPITQSTPCALLQLILFDQTAGTDPSDRGEGTSQACHL